mmetsp:Transcript_3467/g.8344  ORF Transcript_3467/g.8344 Transcript_3467/m.8344 type:complete len:108 (+) Transcript_3467:440-763(+)
MSSLETSIAGGGGGAFFFGFSATSSASVALSTTGFAVARATLAEAEGSTLLRKANATPPKEETQWHAVIASKAKEENLVFIVVDILIYLMLARMRVDVDVVCGWICS